MIEIKIKDNCFSHAKLFGNGDLKLSSKYFNWYRGNEEKEICFFTDMSLTEVNNFNKPRSKINVAWLLEPPSISPQIYQWIKQNYSFFDYVLTYNKELISIDKKFKWYPHGGCWLKPEDYGIFNKVSKISIIASNKTQTIGHKLRHEVISTFKDKIDLVCGRGYYPFEYKIEALKPFKYSIVIENGQFETYFTEKIIDCFMTGTIPIYWGCSLKGLFDENGIIYFNSINELHDILYKIEINEINYNDMLLNVRCNFEKAKKYTITEDWLFENFIKDLI